MAHQRLQRGGMTILAEGLRRRGADPDVVVFQRCDERLDSLLRPEPHDGVDRRQAHRGGLIGQRQHELIGETLLAEFAHQRDRLLPNHGIAVFRRQQQLVVIALALDVDVDRERVQFHRQRG